MKRFLSIAFAAALMAPAALFAQEANLIQDGDLVRRTSGDGPDLYRVPALGGMTLKLQVEAASPAIISLYSPSGAELSSKSGSGKVSLEMKVTADAVYFVGISNSGSGIPYTLTVGDVQGSSAIVPAISKEEEARLQTAQALEQNSENWAKVKAESDRQIAEREAAKKKFEQETAAAKAAQAAHEVELAKAKAAEEAYNRQVELYHAQVRVNSGSSSQSQASAPAGFSALSGSVTPLQLGGQIGGDFASGDRTLFGKDQPLNLYSFSGRKNQRIIVEVRSPEVHSGVWITRDPKYQQEIEAADLKYKGDQDFDSVLHGFLPADGVYYIVVRAYGTNRKGGRDASVFPAKGRFTLRLEGD